MSLTVGTSPFGKHPAGRFNFDADPPTGSILYWDPVPYRLRGVFAGETVFDTTDATLLHETGHLPVYYVPEEALAHFRTCVDRGAEQQSAWQTRFDAYQQAHPELAAELQRLIRGELMGHCSTGSSSCEASLKYPAAKEDCVCTWSRDRLR